MKTRNIIMALLACCTLSFTSCDDDDNRFAPESVITKAFDTKYPDAKRVSWENKGGYAKAEFILGSYEADAWFDEMGNWLMTETDIPASDLPKIVIEGLKLTEYANWRIDDVDKVERFEAGCLFIVELEKGDIEVDLHFSENGILLKVDLDGKGDHEYLPELIPNTVKEIVQKLYSGSTIFEIEREGSVIEVDIVHGNIHKEVVLDLSNKWLYTKWEIRMSEVPELVARALKGSIYGSFKIDDIHMIENGDGVSYEFELEDGDRDVTVIFDVEGMIISPSK